MTLGGSWDGHSHSADLSPCSEDAPGDPNRMKLLEALLREAGLQDPSVEGKAAR